MQISCIFAVVHWRRQTDFIDVAVGEPGLDRHFNHLLAFFMKNALMRVHEVISVIKVDIKDLPIRRLKNFRRSLKFIFVVKCI
jgi:hypothetical protein